MVRNKIKNSWPGLDFYLGLNIILFRVNNSNRLSNVKLDLNKKHI